MDIAILTFEGCNELDSLIAFGMLNRVKRSGWRARIACPTSKVKSMNGLVIERQMTLDEARSADVIVVGSGVLTRQIVADEQLMSQLVFDPSRQLIAAQCSGTLILAKLGLLHEGRACTDSTTKPWVQEAGVEVLNQPFYANGNVATAGGCLASIYLTAWIVARSEGLEAAKGVVHYFAPVGEKEEYVARAMQAVSPFLPHPELGAVESGM